MVIRDLRADEIECRVQTVTAKGCSLLLYKDSRVDMAILDETFGIFGWQRIHSRDNANCTILIWDKENKHWVAKEDTGKESFTEKEKGLASDSFKRAGFNVGIGRELYTAPFIWIGSEYVKNVNGKNTVTEKFSVQSIEIENKQIVSLTIVDSKGKIVFVHGRKTSGSPVVDKSVTPPVKEVKQEPVFNRMAMIEYINSLPEDIKEWVFTKNEEESGRKVDNAKFLKTDFLKSIQKELEEKVGGNN